MDTSALVARAAAAIAIGCSLSACMTSVGAQAPIPQGDEAARHTIILAAPLYVETRTRLLEVNKVVTLRPATVGAGAEFWVVKTKTNGDYTPVAPVSHHVRIESAPNGVAVAGADGQRIPVLADEELNVRICSQQGAATECDVVANLMGRILANGQGPIANPTFDRLDYSVRNLIENDTFSDPSRIAAATAHMQGIVQQDRQAAAEADAQGKARALVASQLAQTKRIEAFKRPGVGSIEFCESVMLLSPGDPVGSGTLFLCEQGKATLGELRSYGWEVTSMSRRPDTDSIGRRADQISIAIRKVKTS